MPPLLAREAALLDRHAGDWLGPVVRAVRQDRTPSHDPGLYGPYFRRGLPEVAAVSLDLLLRRGEELLAALPTLRDLAVFDVQGRGAELAAFPLPRHVATLEVADWVLEGDAAALLTSDLLGGRGTVRVWDGADFNYRHLWYAPPAAWPAGPTVEIVEFGGASVTQPGNVPEELNELAAAFAAAGRTLEPIRPYLERFPLLPDQGQNLHPGRFADGRQVLFAHGRDREPVLFAFFDDDGNLVESRQADHPGCCTFYEDYPAWLEREFGYRPGLVRLREFRTPQRLGIQWLPNSLVETLLFQPVQRAAAGSTGELWSWIYDGHYVLNWCNVPWASRRSGEIVAT